MKVKVYFNLRKRLFSVQHKGKVIGHVRSLRLKDVEFRVSEKGRARVLRERRKNVHAYVLGTIDESAENFSFYNRIVIYNPYKYESFVTAHDLKPIYNASHAWLSDKVVYI